MIKMNFSRRTSYAAYTCTFLGRNCYVTHVSELLREPVSRRRDQGRIWAKYEAICLKNEEDRDWRNSRGCTEPHPSVSSHQTSPSSCCFIASENFSFFLGLLVTCALTEALVARSCDGDRPAPCAGEIRWLGYNIRSNAAAVRCGATLWTSNVPQPFILCISLKIVAWKNVNCVPGLPSDEWFLQTMSAYAIHQFPGPFWGVSRADRLSSLL